MTNLEYKIGGLDIDVKCFSFPLPFVRSPKHRFVVNTEDGVRIYVANEFSHQEVVSAFRLDEKLGEKLGAMERMRRMFAYTWGGGYCYIQDKTLVLDSRSQDFGGIPKEVAQKLAELIRSEIEKLGIECSGISVNPEPPVNPNWHEKGF